VDGGQFEIKCLLLDLLAGSQVDSSQSGGQGHSSTRPMVHSTTVHFSSAQFSSVRFGSVLASNYGRKTAKRSKAGPKHLLALPSAECSSVQHQNFGISPVILLCANWSVAGP